MSMTRREFAQLVAGIGLGTSALPARAGSGGDGSAWKGYRDAMVIDACGGPGDPDENDPLALLSAKAIADARASGLTAACVTIAPPSLGAGLEETAKALAAVERELDAHPDSFLKVKHSADLLAAKASGRLGIIYALQDLSFVAATPPGRAPSANINLHGFGTAYRPSMMKRARHIAPPGLPARFRGLPAAPPETPSASPRRTSSRRARRGRRD